MTELLRNHDPSCRAYNTKGRDLEDEPCGCGARAPSARDTATREAAKLEGAREALEQLYPPASTLSGDSSQVTTTKPKAKRLRVTWSKREKALVYHHPDYASNGALLYRYIEGLKYPGDKTLAEELDARDYDLTTLRFSIERKAPK